MRAGEVHHLPLWQDVVEVLSDLHQTKSCELIFFHNEKILTYGQVQHRYNSAFKKANLPYKAPYWKK